ncbi:MAG: hypothetical protein ACR2FO_07885 [Actinomycetota bacterium]
MAKLEESTGFEAARTVHALCLAAEESDIDVLTALWSVDRTSDEWKAIAEQAICSLVGAMRTQAKGAGVTAKAFHKSSIQALLSLEALGAPPAELI